jgi:hypothetical protein
MRSLMRLVGPYAAFGVGAAVSPANGSSDFFAATAQILPVLLLVLAWEAEVFRWRPDLVALPTTDRRAIAAASPASWWQFGTRGLLFLAIVYAEVVSLRGLGGNDISEFNVRLICGAIVACFGGIAALTMLPRGADPSRHADDAGTRQEPQPK